MNSSPVVPDSLDLFGESFVRDPYPALDLLRESAPVHHDPRTGLWLVSRYRDVREVLLDPEAFVPDNAQQAVTPLTVAALRPLARSGFSLPPALADNGGPTHHGLRRLVTRFFNAQRVADAVPLIERTAGELLFPVRERLDREGHCDLVPGFARVLPCRVMMELLGVQGADPLTLARWSDASLELFWGRPSPERQVLLAEQAAGFHSWLTERCTGPAAPGSLMAALRDEAPDTATAVAVCYFVLIAGQATTGQLIATVLRRALDDGAAWERAAAEEGFAEAWSEEVLRREPPVTTWRRRAAREVSVGGVRVPAGAPLLLMLMGTGSDPEVFDDPARLCPHRPNARLHLSFGAGRHRCPGALLARTEAAIALRTAARALPGLVAPAGEEPPLLGLLSFRAPTEVMAHRR
ncbi:cytochrome P450 [Streptomyces sp. NPDC051018]|uniref:cytochrome P450 n=1 Tax=Streptomyces sp. NPDC051018 TaxID=3365639 RepID=UPI00379FEB36